MDKIERKNRRKKSIRKKVFGTPERPRMAVQKSNKSLYVQIIDDVQGVTICGASSQSASGGEKKTVSMKNTNFATVLGEAIAKIAGEKGVKKVVFDRAGNRYHGVIKALADAARKGGLEF
ncbi:MAG: 50S ribosomal protein L18 [Candidatus Omnitrophica bacterium]|nr:50S ribosomal protein L18 [Candidatus Omnitrophota bacterium]MDD5487382.1 50S ribosomal protein L18 [Candidatus Omnitrophota bacterium]